MPTINADKNAPASYMTQLDGVRGLAILGPLLTHFLPAEHALRKIAHWGDLGVNLFFVLSGFLITGILLRCKELTDSRSQSVTVTLKQFYIRRALRIFPLFYAVILVMSLLDLGQVRQTIYWHSFYLSNVGMAIQDKGFGHSTHFWSLAVEEQFYFAWPLLILLVPRRWLVPTILLTILSAPLFRLGISLTSAPWLARKILPFACADALALGALLAVWHANPAAQLTRQKSLRLFLWFGLPLTTLLIILEPLHPIGGATQIVLGRTAQAISFAWLIDYASRGVPGPLGALLSHGPLAYIGRISYGIYILHHFMPEILPLLLGKTGELAHLNPLLQFLIWSAASIALAALSWRLFEKPINNLKDRFPYHISSTTSPTP